MKKTAHGYNFLRHFYFLIPYKFVGSFREQADFLRRVYINKYLIPRQIDRKPWNTHFLARFNRLFTLKKSCKTNAFGAIDNKFFATEHMRKADRSTHPVDRPELLNIITAR